MPTPVFLDYDREALDREYNNRAKVPNALEMLDGFTRESAEARAVLLSRLDLAYGAHPGERLDAFAPTTPPPGGGGAPTGSGSTRPTSASWRVRSRRRAPSPW